ncbi:MAG: hypothetical protein ACJAVI_005735 [Candidatus Azotimanducaceae bacterium]
MRAPRTRTTGTENTTWFEYLTPEPYSKGQSLG